MLAPALLALTAPAPADYPLAAVLDEARASCAMAAPLEDYAKALPARGWRDHAPEPGSWLAAYIEGVEGGGGMKAVHRVFAREVAGRTLHAYVVQLEMTVGGSTGSALSCEIFDTAASGPITPRAIRKWAGRAPTSDPTESEDLVAARWDPGLSPGTDDTAITFRDPVAHAAMRPGLAYTMTATLKGPQ